MAQFKRSSLCFLDKNGTSNVMVPQPILVSHATETVTPGLPDYHTDELEMVSSRMEMINQTKVLFGIEDITAQFLQDSIRPATNKAYDNGWSK
ncbi:hypothetical protein RMATCC62417_14493 [Rhizopus microsporus]|nr:hypothetical protein RMATCC62417_14493 [Rhizopus microsporus]